ncbi:hypothetical protein [Hymenobacter wooponensis]|uniref:Uncharacterized protein n=1 Tax=Hymenobacter wooponensis TaxID=1525360 RepID=A0A4Z0MDU6_9BACT|nr:hypothetical protein [Hymenobacter wooponensis]TGD77681.1 hypothetical protein EU557_23200 [Hymenobacter wooponensis]
MAEIFMRQYEPVNIVTIPRGLLAGCCTSPASPFRFAPSFTSYSDGGLPATQGATLYQITTCRLTDTLLALHFQVKRPDAGPHVIRLAITYEAETIDYQTALNSFLPPPEPEPPYYREVVSSASGQHAH